MNAIHHTDTYKTTMFQQNDICIKVFFLWLKFYLIKHVRSKFQQIKPNVVAFRIWLILRETAGIKLLKASVGEAEAAF